MQLGVVEGLADPRAGAVAGLLAERRVRRWGKFQPERLLRGVEGASLPVQEADRLRVQAAHKGAGLLGRVLAGRTAGSGLADPLHAAARAGHLLPEERSDGARGLGHVRREQPGQLVVQVRGGHEGGHGSPPQSAGGAADHVPRQALRADVLRVLDGREVQRLGQLPAFDDQEHARSRQGGGVVDVDLPVRHAQVGAEGGLAGPVGDVHLHGDAREGPERCARARGVRGGVSREGRDGVPVLVVLLGADVHCAAVRHALLLGVDRDLMAEGGVHLVQVRAGQSLKFGSRNHKDHPSWSRPARAHHCPSPALASERPGRTRPLLLSHRRCRPLHSRPRSCPP